MKFKITRVSDQYKTGVTTPPCKNAIEISRKVEIQPYSSSRIHLPPSWYEEGFNHRIGNLEDLEDVALRDYYDVEWEIEINSLDELMKLIQDEGDIIINGEAIRIYDDHEG